MKTGFPCSQYPLLYSPKNNIERSKVAPYSSVLIVEVAFHARVSKKVDDNPLREAKKGFYLVLLSDKIDMDIC